MKVAGAADLANTQELKPYFTHCDPEDPLAVEQMELNRRQLGFWVNNLPDEDADFESSIKMIAARMGMGLAKVRNIVLAVRKLTRLPKSLQQALDMGHLDLDRIITIDSATRAMKEELLPQLDAYLMKLLTPVSPREVMRQPAAIRNRIKQFLVGIDPEAVQKKIDEQRGVKVSSEVETARVSARLGRDEALEIQQLIGNTQKQLGLDNEADALMALVRQNTTAHATLNLIPNEQGNLHLLGAGTLTPQQMEYWLSKVSKVKIVHEHIDENSTDRLFDVTSQMIIHARDGYCRGLNCTCDAVGAQADHTENFNLTNTQVENSNPLCQHCHNQKTDGRLNMITVNSRGVKMWVTPDGRHHVSLPDGPLVGPGENLLTMEEYRKARAKGKVPTPNPKNWGQTVKQKSDKRIANNREAA